MSPLFFVTELYCLSVRVPEVVLQPFRYLQLIVKIPGILAYYWHHSEKTWTHAKKRVKTTSRGRFGLVPHTHFGSKPLISDKWMVHGNEILFRIFLHRKVGPLTSCTQTQIWYTILNRVNILKDAANFVPISYVLHCYPFSSQLVLNLTLALSWV